MNNFDKDLTLNELEELCRQYLDCKLSVPDEVELEYVLQQVPLRSPLIDEVRTLMGLAHELHLKSEVMPVPRKRRRYGIIAAAASVVLLIGVIAVINLTGADTASDQSHNVYIAYVGGKRVSDAKARIIAEAERANAKQLIKQLEDDKAKAQDQIEQIKKLKHNSK